MSRVLLGIARLWLALGVLGVALLAYAAVFRGLEDVLRSGALSLLAWGMYLDSLGRLRGSRKLRVLGLVMVFAQFPVVLYNYLKWFKLLP